MSAKILTPEKSKASFACDVAGCNKLFKRSDHLLRHKRNHENTSLFYCQWPGCKKSFVRKDVRLKHFKRHVQKENNIKHKQIKFFEIQTPGQIANPHSDAKASRPVARKARSDDASQISASLAQQPNLIHHNDLSPGADALTPTQNGLTSNITSSQDTLAPALTPNPDTLPMQGFQMPLESMAMELPEPMALESTDEMNNLLEWLLDDTHDNSHKYLKYSPTSSFKDLLETTPSFIDSVFQSRIFDADVQRMAEYIPLLSSHPLFNAECIEQYLESFWNVYHIQYPVIHRPTFSTQKAPPLLLLSMVAMGASLRSRSCGSRDVKLGMIKLAETIAIPLRWLICLENETFETSTSWVIQSLLILEVFEITCSSRKLHRRAHLHHGFKIELLRRSPLLGGRPLGSDYLDKDDVWESWVEFESLKRCAYVTFHIDIFHGIIFGHEAVLSTHHIKLSLPCADNVWEGAIDKNEGSKHLNDTKFLLLMTNLVKHKPVACTPLVSNILLAGLISLVFQTEQSNSQIRVQDQKLKPWKNELLLFLDFWYDNVIGSRCDSAQKAYYFPLDLTLTELGKEDDTSCRFSVYHLSQAFLRVPQYDCIIYAGAPERMNVKTSIQDYNTVDLKIHRWAVSQDGRLAVVHSYVILIETLFKKDDSGALTRVTYHPNEDLNFYRPNIIASALFLIWDYTFCLYGPESMYLEHSDSLSSANCFPELINGYKYMENVKSHFDSLAQDTMSSKKFLLYADALADIENKNHTVGLLRLFKRLFIECNSQVCREYGRLMENCIQRSLGRKTVTCTDMYDDK